MVHRRAGDFMELPMGRVATAVIIAMLTGSALAQTDEQPTRGTFDEAGPRRSSPVGVRERRPGVDTTAETAPSRSSQSLGGVRMEPVRKAYPTGRMNRALYPRWNLQKLYPTGFPRIMPYGFPRIMPLGLPKIPENVGQVKSNVSLIENPRRFLSDAPVPADAPLRVLQNSRRFEPGVVRGAIAEQDRPMLARVAGAAKENRKYDTQHVTRSAGARDEFERAIRRRAMGKPSPSRGFAIAGPVSYDPKLRPARDDQAEVPLFDARNIGSNPAGEIEGIRQQLRKTPDDYHLMRLLALAYVADRNYTDAASAIARAYESDPLLVDEPIDLAALGIEARRITNIITNLQAVAGKLGANGHLLTLVLQQSHASPAQARGTLERARAAGLEPELAALFEQALRSPGPGNAPLSP